ncbi:Fe(2+) transport protein A/Fe(2+) transporter protein B [Desulfonema limicola]|uniref:Ferrous iron transport protein B n=1 Tax=Desulfonema limicola TaxID=45656 RepID=A0A975B8A2_9BACT|nr:ferrous iron transport protein B [Desulfonema limicola]QTA80710.1 Fe(2+) transport protein A/Fe(2+) transporter protein B [Desulfonema limicola]
METVIALAGNPNSGKTTIFNSLTGARQHVGNYPGITVEKKQGLYKNNGNSINIIDLPGIYSLSAYSQEEAVARDFITDSKPGLVIDTVDASNLQRNLYLTIQFMEMGAPVCIALNMMDVAEKQGLKIDVPKLSSLLGIPVVPIIARTGKGKKELMDTAIESVKTKPEQKPLAISYGEDLDNALFEMIQEINSSGFLTDRYNPRWTALKYLEGDELILKLGNEAGSQVSEKLCSIVQKAADHLHKTLGTTPEAVIADHRYGYINSLVRQGVIQYPDDKERIYISDKIDMVLTNRFMGPVIMFLVIMGLYQFTFKYSEIPVGWVENFFALLGETAQIHLPDGLMKSLVISGIIDGVGGVLGFVPLIMFMFLGISFLEDTGYLARAAYMLDRVFRFFGLHGNSVMPFIISGGIAGGCAVPGIMAARTLKSPMERLATLLTVPFMNCGAKLPVFALLVAAFFPGNKAGAMFAITLVSWAGALLAAKFLRMTIIKGESTPFVMELPPYRLPTFKGMLIHTWERTWQYIKKAGTVILAISVILWAMMTFPGLPENISRDFETQRESVISGDPLSAVNKLAEIDAQEAEAALRYSAAGHIGTALEGLTQWAGFDWRTNIALLGGFAAKEVVVSTLGTAYSLGEIDAEESSSLSQRLASSPGWSPLTALSLIIFTIFYSPCFVSVVCIAKEAGSWKWGAFSVIFNTLLAFILAAGVFQSGKLLSSAVEQIFGHIIF